MKTKSVNRERLLPYLYILPAAGIYGLFIFYSLAQNVWLSFFRWTGLRSEDRVWVGMLNYIELFHDQVFFDALLHNVIWVILTLAFPMTVGLVLAAILIHMRSRLILSAIYFIPRTIPFVIAAIVWGWIYNPIFGLLNVNLRRIGLGILARSWLSDPSIALYALNFAGAWNWFGFCGVIFINALEEVNPTLYEAARMDGASYWQQFIHITIPSLKNTIVFLTVYSIIGAMAFFDLVWISTKGGPGSSTEILATFIFKMAFREYRLGYAATPAVMLMIIVLTVSVFLTARTGKK